MYTYIYIYIIIHIYICTYNYIYNYIYTVIYILVHISMCALKIETFIQFRIGFCAAIVIGIRRTWNMYLTLWRTLMIKFRVSKHSKLLIQTQKKIHWEIFFHLQHRSPDLHRKIPRSPLRAPVGQGWHVIFPQRCDCLDSHLNTGGGEWSGGQNLGSWPCLWG